MHRNLKPENVLVDGCLSTMNPPHFSDQIRDSGNHELKVCLTDFAMSRSIQDPGMEKYTPEDPKERDRSGREHRRLFYRAPELMFRPNHYG